jgi:hypothetical protein
MALSTSLASASLLAVQAQNTQSCHQADKRYQKWYYCASYWYYAHLFVRESWLSHVLSRLDSFFLGDASQNAKQFFSTRLPQTTKYCIIRECENIFHGYLYVCDLAFVILKGIYGFKFPKRFLEISSRDLTSFPLKPI